MAKNRNENYDHLKGPDSMEVRIVEAGGVTTYGPPGQRYTARFATTIWMVKDDGDGRENTYGLLNEFLSDGGKPRIPYENVEERSKQIALIRSALDKEPGSNYFGIDRQTIRDLLVYVGETPFYEPAPEPNHLEDNPYG